MELAGGWTIGRLVECKLTELDRVLEDLVARDEYEPIRDVVVTLAGTPIVCEEHIVERVPAVIVPEPEVAELVE